MCQSANPNPNQTLTKSDNGRSEGTSVHGYMGLDPLLNSQWFTDEKLNEYMGIVTALQSATKKDPENRDKDHPKCIFTFLWRGSFVIFFFKACVACSHESEKKIEKELAS